jgi:hypothetical protein
VFEKGLWTTRCSDETIRALAGAVYRARVRKAEIGWELDELESAVQAIQAGEGADSDDESEVDSDDDEEVERRLLL